MTDAGPIWAPAVRRLDDMIGLGGDDAARFDAALREGFFSQYTRYADPDFVASVVDWQLSELERQGVAIASQPASIEESPIIPDRLCLQRSGRRVSADFLRNLAYVHELLAGRTLRAPLRALEIGGGYGAFARLLKLFCPSMTVFMVDLQPMLRCAEYFLRRSFPDAKILAVEVGAELPDAVLAGDKPGHDFVLVPVESAHAIVGAYFSLAVNIWSFGEMPDAYIGQWFDLIQNRNSVDVLFTINAFLHPVERGQAHLLTVGNWLPRLDPRWHVERLEADVAIHRCPYILDFPSGLLVLAKRLDPKEQARERETIAAAFERVLKADWIAEAFGDAMDRTPEKLAIERPMDRSRYIAIHSLARIEDGTFLALWNTCRTTGSPLAAALLVVYCRLLCRLGADFEKATREELFYIRQVRHLPLAENYRSFLRDGVVSEAEEPAIEIEATGELLSLQEASDRATAARSRLALDDAESLLAQIVERVPAYADAWFQLGQLASAKGAHERALLFLGLAVEFYPGWLNYTSALEQEFLALGALGEEHEIGVPGRAWERARSYLQAAPYDAEAMLSVLAALPGYSWRREIFEMLAALAARHGEVLLARAFRSVGAFVAYERKSGGLSTEYEFPYRRHLASLMRRCERV